MAETLNIEDWREKRKRKSRASSETFIISTWDGGRIRIDGAQVRADKAGS